VAQGLKHSQGLKTIWVSMSIWFHHPECYPWLKELYDDDRVDEHGRLMDNGWRAGPEKAAYMDRMDQATSKPFETPEWTENIKALRELIEKNENWFISVFFFQI